MARQLASPAQERMSRDQHTQQIASLNSWPAALIRYIHEGIPAPILYDRCCTFTAQDRAEARSLTPKLVLSLPQFPRSIHHQKLPPPASVSGLRVTIMVTLSAYYGGTIGGSQRL